MGGKSRIGKRLAAVIQTFNPTVYDEPFCGMFSVGKHVVAQRRSAGDIHPDLILFHKAVQNGWVPPAAVGEETYTALRKQPPSALRGYVGFAYSFYGKFFGGYARAKGMDFGHFAYTTTMKTAPHIRDVTFRCESYRDYHSDADVIYCDPPYAGTTDFSHGTFKTDEFWDWVRSRREIVLVSEYTAPKDFQVIWEQPVTTTMRNKQDRGCARVERLFQRKP
jgi:DNA adenine methylase